jgi:DNA mismatch repair ATPase MutL
MIQQYYLNQFTKRFEYSNVDSKGSTTTSVFVAQKTLKDALMQTFGIETVQALQNLVAELDGYRIECWLPKSLDQKAWNSVAQYYIYANSKIISYSSNALFKDFISKIQKCFKTTKYPFLYLNIVVPLQDIDSISN